MTPKLASTESWKSEDIFSLSANDKICRFWAWGNTLKEIKDPLSYRGKNGLQSELVEEEKEVNNLCFL